MKKIKNILFDLGNTLIYQERDFDKTLDMFDLKLQPNVFTTLEHLHKKFELGVISNTETSNSTIVEKVLKTHNCEMFFKTIITSVDVGFKKPNYLIFEKALKTIKGKANESVMIGNDVYADILGAQKIGMTTVFYSKVESDINSLRNSNVKPDYVINDLLDLIKISTEWTQ